MTATGLLMHPECMSNIKFYFPNHHVLVTGGAAGIGHQITRQFLQAGATVTVWDYAEAALQACRADFAEFGPRLHTAAVDVSRRESIQKAAAELTSPLHVVVNNAGITRDKSFGKMAPEDWDAVIAVNLTGLFNVSKLLLDRFDGASNQKRIINISSVVGLYGNFGQANYAAAKAGVLGLTKTLAKELGRKGFTVNAVAPGFIRTAMTAAMPADVLQQMAGKVPVSRLGETADIANAVLFLAGEQASYLNGAVLSVDGGLVL